MTSSMALLIAGMSNSELSGRPVANAIMPGLAATSTRLMMKESMVDSAERENLCSILTTSCRRTPSASSGS